MNKYEIINANAEQVAGAIHGSIGEANPAVLDLVRWTEENFSIKIKIRFLERLKVGHSGFVYPDPKSGAFIVGINVNEMDCRQRFTMCHELAHVIRNVGLKYGFSCGEIYTANGLERFCDRFAAAFLMPKELFIKKWHSLSDKDVFKKARIARFFRVSGQAVYHRARELKLI